MEEQLMLSRAAGRRAPTRLHIAVIHCTLLTPNFLHCRQHPVRCSITQHEPHTPQPYGINNQLPVPRTHLRMQANCSPSRVNTLSHSCRKSSASVRRPVCTGEATSAAAVCDSSGMGYRDKM